MASFFGGIYSPHKGNKIPSHLKMERETNVSSKLHSQEVRSSLTKYEVKESYVDTIKQQLEQTIYGQEEACYSVARAIARVETGINDPNRPAAVLMFLGPTGVGKTEMSHSVSNYLFGLPDSNQLKFIDCATLNERHATMRFLGAPPSYVGYADTLLIERDFLSKRNVIVFDEIEKAHPAVCQMLLSVLDNARLNVRSDQFDEELNFANSYIIFTSNVGAREVNKSSKQFLGFVRPTAEADTKLQALSAMKDHFKNMPEFLGRIDETVVFNRLGKEQYDRIFNKEIANLNALMMVRGLETYFATTAELRDELVRRAVGTGEYGARDMRKVIQKELIHPLSDVLGELPKGNAIVADIEDGEVVFYTT